MEELVTQIAEKLGISEEQAQQAVDAVMEFLKDKLPGDMMGQLDGVLGSLGDMAGDALDAGEGAADSAEDAAGGMMDSLKKGLGGLLGGDK